MTFYQTWRPPEGFGWCRCKPSSHPAPFTLYKIDIETKKGLSGAVFELMQNGQPVAQSTSDSCGAVRFPCLYPGSYLLAETLPPPGYVPSQETWIIAVLEDGTVTVNGKNRGIPVTIHTVAVKKAQ